MVKHDKPLSNLALARQNFLQAIQFGLIWGMLLALHTIAKLYWLGWQSFNSIQPLALVIFAGTFVGGTMGWFIAIWLSAHRQPAKKFATTLVSILLFTVGTTALIFAMQYRIYYSQWHMPAFSIGWFFQLFFTGISALYLFAVQGLRLLLPFAPVGLLIASAYFVKLSPKSKK